MASDLMIDTSLDVDKLSYEIFSILESKFLLNYQNPTTPLSQSPPETPFKLSSAAAGGKVRILSIDAAADGAILAAVSLCRLESSLQKQSANPSARIADFFDVAAGSGAGGVLAAMLFTHGADGRPLFSADDSLQFLIKNRSKINSGHRKRGLFSGIARKSPAAVFERIFPDWTVRDAIKPVLISCYDLVTGSPFMFSRSDAVESDGYDFSMKDVCAATCADRAVEMRSVDGRTRIRAIGRGAGMGNPTAAAITHVLNNKREFPFADGPEDLLVVSLGSGEAAELTGKSKSRPSDAEILSIAGEWTADLVDQSVAMAFGPNGPTNYVRIQANAMTSVRRAESRPVAAAETALSERNVESVMFRGKKISDRSNGERLEWASTELIKEHDRRKRSSVPTVVIKPSVTSPRTSSATTSTTITTASTGTSGSI